MSLVGDRRAAPLQVGAILVLDAGAGLDPMAVRSALEQRLPAAPRLRRRLVRPPLGLGRPLWVDHAAFRIEEHFAVRAEAGPITHQELLDVAARLAASPLPPDRPLWRATLVPDVEPGRAALIVVFHHVLADGVAGLTLLADLLAAGPAPEGPLVPPAGTCSRRPPGRRPSRPPELAHPACRRPWCAWWRRRRTRTGAAVEGRAVLAQPAHRADPGPADRQHRPAGADLGGSPARLDGQRRSPDGRGGRTAGPARRQGRTGEVPWSSPSRSPRRHQAVLRTSETTAG